MSLYCGRYNSPILIHLGRDDHQHTDSLIAIADRYQCPVCGADGTYYVYIDGDVLLTDCLSARGDV